MRRYGEQIAVLLVHEREYVAPLSREVIERALEEAAGRSDEATPARRPGVGRKLMERINPWSKSGRAH